ncbi:hypothetical protein CON00_00115 [Bacillus sp. AFS096315]|nr:hypothetical protein CON00_00115 [Bacillus sp. AFS096315]
MINISWIEAILISILGIILILSFYFFTKKRVLMIIICMAISLILGMNITSWKAGIFVPIVLMLHTCMLISLFIKSKYTNKSV